MAKTRKKLHFQLILYSVQSSGQADRVLVINNFVSLEEQFGLHAVINHELYAVHDTWNISGDLYSPCYLRYCSHTKH